MASLERLLSYSTHRPSLCQVLLYSESGLYHDPGGDTIEIRGTWTAGEHPVGLVCHLICGEPWGFLKVSPEEEEGSFESLWERCAAENRAGVWLLEDGVGEALVAPLTYPGPDPGSPPSRVFAIYRTTMASADFAAAVLRRGRLPLVFDLDETLLMARSQSQLQRELVDLSGPRRQRLMQALERARADLGALERERRGEEAMGEPEGEEASEERQMEGSAAPEPLLETANGRAPAEEAAPAAAAPAIVAEEDAEGGTCKAYALSAEEEDLNAPSFASRVQRVSSELENLSEEARRADSPGARASLIEKRASAAEAALRALEAEQALVVRDLSLLQQFASADCVEWRGRRVAAVSEEAGSPGSGLVRPVIRLEGGTLVLTRIEPSQPSTSMVFYIRPGWQTLRPFLTGERGQHGLEFEVYVCTAARREYALEAWRVLDPGARLMAVDARDRHITTTKAKDLAQVLCVPPPPPGCFVELQLRGGEEDTEEEAEEKIEEEHGRASDSRPASACSAPRPALPAALSVLRSAMPLAVIVDDRLDVWAPSDRPQVLQVEAFRPYEELSRAAEAPALAQMQKLHGELHALREAVFRSVSDDMDPAFRTLVSGKASKGSPPVLHRPTVPAWYAASVPPVPWVAALQARDLHRRPLSAAELGPWSLEEGRSQEPFTGPEEGSGKGGVEEPGTVPADAVPRAQAPPPEPRDPRLRAAQQPSLLPSDPRQRGPGPQPPADPRQRPRGEAPPAEKRARTEGGIQLDPDLVSTLLAMQGPPGQGFAKPPGSEFAQQPAGSSERTRQPAGSEFAKLQGPASSTPPVPAPSKQPPARGGPPPTALLLEAAKAHSMMLEYEQRAAPGGGWSVSVLWNRRPAAEAAGPVVEAVREEAARRALQALQLPGGGGGRGAGAPGGRGSAMVSGGRGPGIVSGGRGPGIVAPGGRGSGIVAPGGRGPGIVASGGRGPGNIAPGGRGPGSIAPGGRGPGNIAPGGRGPGIAAPGGRGPGIVAPGGRGPGIVAPGGRGPGIVAPGGRGPGIVAPGAPGPPRHPGRGGPGPERAREPISQPVRGEAGARGATHGDALAALHLHFNRATNQVNFESRGLDARGFHRAVLTVNGGELRAEGVSELDDRRARQHAALQVLERAGYAVDYDSPESGAGRGRGGAGPRGGLRGGCGPAPGRGGGFGGRGAGLAAGPGPQRGGYAGRGEGAMRGRGRAL